MTFLAPWRRLQNSGRLATSLDRKLRTLPAAPARKPELFRRSLPSATARESDGAIASHDTPPQNATPPAHVLAAANRPVAPRSSREARRDRDCICRPGRRRPICGPGIARSIPPWSLERPLWLSRDRPWLRRRGRSSRRRNTRRAGPWRCCYAVQRIRRPCGARGMWPPHRRHVPMSRVNASKTFASANVPILLVWTERGDRWPVRTFLFYRNRERLFGDD